MARRTAIGSHSLTSSLMNTRLPSDFDIFVPSYSHHRRVQPVAHEPLAGGRLGLGRLALVVGEDQVGPAAVQVDGGAQLAHGQGRALDVPAGPARAPQRVPRRLVGRRRLPQDEVERVALGRVVGVARPARRPAPASRRGRGG